MHVRIDRDDPDGPGPAKPFRHFEGESADEVQLSVPQRLHLFVHPGRRDEPDAVEVRERAAVRILPVVMRIPLQDDFPAGPLPVDHEGTASNRLQGRFRCSCRDDGGMIIARIDGELGIGLEQQEPDPALVQNPDFPDIPVQVRRRGSHRRVPETVEAERHVLCRNRHAVGETGSGAEGEGPGFSVPGFPLRREVGNRPVRHVDEGEVLVDLFEELDIGDRGREVGVQGTDRLRADPKDASVPVGRVYAFGALSQADRSERTQNEDEKYARSSSSCRHDGTSLSGTSSGRPSKQNTLPDR